MAGYRRKRNPRKRRKAVSWYNKKYSTMDIAYKAFKGVKAIKKLINVEKFIWDDGGTTALSTTPYVFNVQQIGTGDTYESRTGLSIKPQYLKVHMQIFPNTTATNNFYRIVVVRDNQQVSDTAPAWTDVFSGSTTYAFRNHTTMDRFNVLMDKILSSAPATAKPIMLQEHLSLHGHIKYNGTASTDVQKGGLYLMYLGNQGTDTSNVIFSTRLVYTDN